MNWQGRKVLVTGADGFIGSHLTEALVRNGADVRAFCMYNSMGSRGWLDEVGDDVGRALDVRLGDIRDRGLVESACEGVEVVFHLAALIAIPYSYLAPESFVDTNVGGTLNVLEAARRHGCGRIVQTSTSEVYGTPDEVPITEDFPLRGQSPYSASKIAADKLCEAFHCSFDVPVVTLRPFNTYGPRQSMRAVIPTILAQLLNGHTEVRLGNVTPRRDLTFVGDTVAGFLAAGSVPGIEGETIQLGTGRAVSVADVFEIANSVCGTNATIVSETKRIRPDRSEVMILQADPSRARETLGWESEVSLEDGLLQTAEWIRGRLRIYGTQEYVV